jgi:hypothetical protein
MNYPQWMLLELLSTVLAEGGFARVQKSKANERDMRDFEVPIKD